MTDPAEFKQNGYCLQRSLFDEADLADIRRVIRTGAPPEPCLWSKDLGASDANFFRIATHPAIVRRLKPLLGEQFILWGASFLKRNPGQTHPWHTDIESSRPEGGFVTVWIGLEGTNRKSSLKLLPGSHTFGKSLQEIAKAHGATREATDDSDVSAWAREFTSAACDVVQPDITDGDAIFFDGRLWHGSSNGNPDLTRYALLFQYAVADAPVRIPDFSQLSVPFRFFENPKPPCVAVGGEPDPRVNSFVEDPPVLDSSLARLGSTHHAMDCETGVPKGERIRQQHFLDGWSANLQRMRSHYSVLAPGQTPHEPHSHVDEELLLVVQGEATLRYDDGSGAITDHRVAAGNGVYYPAFHRHTLHNHGDVPVVYLMFKWVASRGATRHPLPVQRFTVSAIETSDLPDAGFSSEECFTGATHHLKNLHAHVSTVLPKAGYDVHADDHDIALIVLEGRVETLDRTVSAGEFVWYAGGEPHGMFNPGPEPARYIVFEFHGEGCSGDYGAYSRPGTPRTLLKKRKPGRILKNLRRIVRLGR